MQVVVLSDLGGDVVRRPTEGGGGDTVKDSLLAHSKVGQLTVTLRVQQDVVQLQVSAGREDAQIRKGHQEVIIDCKNPEKLL